MGVRGSPDSPARAGAVAGLAVLKASSSSRARPDDAPADAPPRAGWPFELAFAAAILLDSLLPAWRFRIRIDAADGALLICVVLSGGAVIRTAHALLAGCLRRPRAPRTPPALGA